MLIEESMGIAVIDQASDHARYASMIKQVFEKELRLIIIQRLIGYGSSDA